MAKNRFGYFGFSIVEWVILSAILLVILGFSIGAFKRVWSHLIQNEPKRNQALIPDWQKGPPEQGRMDPNGRSLGLVRGWDKRKWLPGMIPPEITLAN